MTALLLLWTAACMDDPVRAGTAYREAQEALRAGKDEDALAKLQEAIRAEPRETDQLHYRDREGRHQDPYHPHYLWAQIRIRQAKEAPELPRQQTLYREAIVHLELSQHPEAAERLKTAKASLSSLEKLPDLRTLSDASLVAVAKKLDELCDRERFAEALALAELERALLERFPPERQRLLDLIRERRSEALKRYARILDQGLETIAITDPVAKSDVLDRLLQPALPPRQDFGELDPRFDWADELLALSRKEAAAFRTPGASPLRELIRAAEAFDGLARKALEIRCLAGFRAAANLGQSLRWARLKASPGGEPDELLRNAEASLSSLEEALRPRLAEPLDAADRAALENFRTAAWTPFRSTLTAIRRRREERERLDADLDRCLTTAEQALTDPARMSSPEKLRAVAGEMAGLEEHPRWNETAARSRARALFVRCLLEAVAALLEGVPAATIAERLAPALQRSRDLDPEVAADREGRLSPRLRAILDRRGP